MYNFMVSCRDKSKKAKIVNILESAIEEFASNGNSGYCRDDLEYMLEALTALGVGKLTHTYAGNARVPGTFVFTASAKTPPRVWKALEEGVIRARLKRSLKARGPEWAEYVVLGDIGPVVEAHLRFNPSKTFLVQDGGHVRKVSDGVYTIPLTENDALCGIVGVHMHANEPMFTINCSKKCYNWLGQLTQWDYEKGERVVV